MSNETPALGRVKVLLSLPLAGALDYTVPSGLTLAPGVIVAVPLRGREEIGVVWDGAPDATLAASRLKPVIRDFPPFLFPPRFRGFIDWVAAYTLTPPGSVLAMALRVNALTPERPAMGLRRATPQPESGRLTPARARALEILGDRCLAAATLAAESSVSAAQLRAMLHGGWLDLVPIEAAPAPPIDGAAPRLSPDQRAAAQDLRDAVSAASFSVTLLQGATGSGKTEVYFEAIEQALAAGRQALVLLPEIALSTQWLRRFEQRFGAAASVWHSDLTPKSRRATWRGVATGQTRVVVGARSALFLPFTTLGLIIVDEEHETSFKQEDGVIYHARDMAVVRGRFEHAAVVLVSATPSLESVANSDSGRYRRIDLPRRFGGASLPSVTTLDLRAHPPERGAFLSPALIEQIGHTISRGEQAMLFLNRRGYAPLTLCRACGHRLHCPNCTAWLVEHRLRRTAACHHCGHAEPMPRACPACGAPDSLAAIGPGVERITEEVARLFPDARRLVMASDTLAGPNAAAAAASAIEAREIDLIIGTQIVAKGWHFPHLTLVGVVDADLGLAGGDLRAAERTMQLLHQVAGRAGRAEAPGSALLQTYQPDHPVMRALVAGDLAGFMRAEADQRRPGHWPPYGRLAALIVSADDAAQADQTANALGRAAPDIPGIIVLGPAPAPLSILRGRHRRRLLLRASKDMHIQPLLRHWLSQVPTPANTRVDIDIDPISFL